MGQRIVTRLDGEQELLDLITNQFPYGATIDQLTQIFDHKGRRLVSVSQLLEVLVTSDEVHVADQKLYKPGPAPKGLVVATPVTGEVSETHFKCEKGHEFSVLIKGELPADDTWCVALGCKAFAYSEGTNKAVVGKSLAGIADN